MFTEWERGTLLDLVNDEITRLTNSPYDHEKTISDLWDLHYKLEDN